jgi:hexosaminidase
MTTLLGAALAALLGAVPAPARTLAARPAARPTAQPTVPADSIAIVPRPSSLTPRAGRFVLGPRTVIWTDAASAPLGRQLARWLEPATGWTLAVRTGGAPPAGSIALRRDASLARLSAEGYTLDVRAGGVVARAPQAAGLFYAVQTMRQLLPPEVFRDAPVTGAGARAAGGWAMPAVAIEDVPRFSWRGAHLDVGRHFMPKEFIKKYIDLLALHKLNTFHWHLTEDQGWRLEIKKYPRLTEAGAWRASTIVGHMIRDTTKAAYDSTPHGGYYTQDDAREIVAYARARFVNVVPEIEMPGHARAAIHAYPQLGVSGDPITVWTNWGVTPYILNADASTVAFMQDVLAEVLDVFPSRFIHVGGDEAPKTQWQASPRIQARIKELGVKDEHELQSWFIKQMDTWLTAKGRRLVGWDEILEGGLAPGATVMSWRGIKGGIEAAQSGHDVVMAPGSHTYLDKYESRDTVREGLAIGGYLPIDTVYAFEPVPAELSPEQARHVLGAQAQLWTEYMADPKRVEYMAFPRLAALAEVVWTPRDRKDFADFRRRLDTHLRRLDALDVAYRRPEPRAAGR